MDAKLEARLRRDARALLDAALAAVDPGALVEHALRARAPEPGEGGTLVVLAVGKAALGMAAGALRALGDRVARSLVLMPTGSGGHAPDGFEVYRGGHPLPDTDGLEGARALVEAARRAGPADRLLVLISGGGSALLTLPAGEVTLEDVREVTSLLLSSGAPIGELNAVRKHLDEIKGGGLARVAMPAPVRALVLSDVVGDPLDVIASGPLSPDPTTYADAIAVLERRALWDRVPNRVRRHLETGRDGHIPETPKRGDPLFAGVDVELIGSVSHALAAASARADEMGYRASIVSATVTGEARSVGRDLARRAREVREASRPVMSPAALIAGGETTVTVRGNGRGGRNQEVALGAALDLAGSPGVLVMSAGTDGVDGPTDAAGALATGSTLERARSSGLDAEDHLARNDAYAFFEALGDLVKTGPTGTNVMDVMIVLVAR
ncbi:MAG: glycerate kinase [Gemmatimonadetes bacterium]|nr:glycerate kinase [Gemmatimonadota bacterium]